MLITPEFDAAMAEMRKDSVRNAKIEARRLRNMVGKFLEETANNPHISRKHMTEITEILFKGIKS